VKTGGRAAFKLVAFFVVTFCDELPYCSKLIWITHLQNPHAARWNAFLLKDTKIEVCTVCAVGVSEHYTNPQNND
jgi:hypothetical protein